MKFDSDIKEILDRVKKNPHHDYILSNNHTQQLLDYITNLQEENERLKEWKEDLLSENIELENIRKEAIELIKRSAGYKGICTQSKTDTFSTLLEILGDK